LFYSLDAIEVVSIPISWLAISFIFIVSTIYLLDCDFDTEFKFVVLLMILLSVPNIFSFVNSTYHESLSSQYVLLRLLNYISFFIVFLYVIKANFSTSLIIKVLLFCSLVFTCVGILIYYGQVYDIADIIRNRSGTGIYGNEDQVTFWLSEDHRAMSTFREPIFFVSFLLPIAFISMASKINFSFLVAVLSGYVMGLTRSDLVYVIALITVIVVIVSYLFNRHFIYNNVKLLLFVFFVFIGSVSTLRECDVNKTNDQCPSYIYIEGSDNEGSINSRDGSISENFNSEFQSTIFLDEERRSVYKYLQGKIFSYKGVGVINANSEYTEYFSNTNLFENYLTIRTTPIYLSTRYLTEPFGTGDTYYLYGNINLQNLVIFNLISHGTIFLVLLVAALLLLTKKIIYKDDYFPFVTMASVSLLAGVFEEISSFQAIIAGLIYVIYRESSNLE